MYFTEMMLATAATTYLNWQQTIAVIEGETCPPDGEENIVEGEERKEWEVGEEVTRQVPIGIHPRCLQIS